MTTQREPDTSAGLEYRALSLLLDLASAAWDAADNTETTIESGEARHTMFDPWWTKFSNALDALDDLPDDQPGYTMNGPAKAGWALNQLRVRVALADAAGQAAPVPPPVEGLETACIACGAAWPNPDCGHRKNAEYERKAPPCAPDMDARARAAHDRAEGLAKEVERLQRQIESFEADADYHRAQRETIKRHKDQIRDLKAMVLAAEAKLAVYEAPVADGELERLIRHSEVPKAAVDFIRRLSREKAGSEAREANLREDVSRTLDDIDKCVRVTAAIARDEIPGAKRAIPGTGVEISLDHIKDATGDLRSALASSSPTKEKSDG